MKKRGVSVKDVGDVPFQHHFSLSPAGLAWVEDFCADRSTVDKVLPLLAVNTQKSNPADSTTFILFLQQSPTNVWTCFIFFSTCFSELRWTPLPETGR